MDFFWNSDSWLFTFSNFHLAWNHYCAQLKAHETHLILSSNWWHCHFTDCGDTIILLNVEQLYHFTDCETWHYHFTNCGIWHYYFIDCGDTIISLTGEHDTIISLTMERLQQLRVIHNILIIWCWNQRHFKREIYILILQLHNFKLFCGIYV